MAVKVEDFKLNTIEEAVAAIASGRPVIVVDDPARENEADLIMAAEAATSEWMAFFIRYSSGIICAPMSSERCDFLALPPMHVVNQDHRGTAFTVSVDARVGITTGVSAADRARTLNLLASSAVQPEQLRRPGHVFGLRARDGGVLERPGHTEASLDLMKLADLRPVAALAELINLDGTMMRLADIIPFASDHQLVIIAIADLTKFRRLSEVMVEELTSAQLPTQAGIFRVSVWRDSASGAEHVVLVAGKIPVAGPVLVRVHSECLTGDVLGSQRCDCGPQLQSAMAQIAAIGSGVVIYMSGHEGRGIGIADKIRAYALQDDGVDTVDANLQLGLPVDAREYHVAGQILRAMGVRQVRLLTNNPLKVQALSDYIEVVANKPLRTIPNEHNESYLKTKQQRLQHTLDVIETSPTKRKSKSV